MLLAEINPQDWILALFVRDDGERLMLGDGGFSFDAEQLHYTANTIANDVVELQGTDGQILAGQVRRSSAQEFNGFIGDGATKRTETEKMRRRFLSFFLTNHHYTVAYVSCAEKPGDKNSAIARKRGYLVDAPEVRELYQQSPMYHVSLAFEDVNYYQYAEDPSGDEIFANDAELMQGGAVIGGLVWDEQGVVWDEAGGIWEGAITPDTQRVENNGIGPCSFVWIIDGFAKNPTLQNVTTGEAMQYAGEVQAGSELVIDMGKKTAKLDGVNVYDHIRGDWMKLAQGINMMNFNAETENSSRIKWNEVVG